MSEASSKTISKWLANATAQLEASHIGTARLDALVLLEDATGKHRAWLLAHPELELTAQQIDILNNNITQRIKHVPLSYIRGRVEFYGREFIVNHNVLEPRPESETIIDIAKELDLDSPTIIDVGTGSGALAITIKLEMPKAHVLATDIDKKCLGVAKKNAQAHHVDVDFYHGSLLAPIPHTVYSEPLVLLCNLPYVPDSYTINEAALMEPRHAIFGGKDGLDLYRELFMQIGSLPIKPTYILTESLPFQHSDLFAIAERTSYRQVREEDFIQLFAYES